MKSLLILNGNEYEVDFSQISVRHKEFEDYETVVSLEFEPIETVAIEEGTEAVGVNKPNAIGIQKPKDEILDLKSAGIDEKLLTDLRKSLEVDVFASIPDNKVVHGTVWSVETRRYNVSENDPIGAAVRDLVRKEKDIIGASFAVNALWIESGPSVKLVKDGFHLTEKVQQLKDKDNGSKPSAATS